MNLQKGDKLTHEQAMSLAIAEAYKGAPYVSPNPLVGCVVLDKADRFLASGYHTRYGAPHAEVEAFRKLTEAELENSQFFVTLEPCAHEGKTPSCAKSLAKMKLRSVVYGLTDPNPLVAGQGAQIIRDAGVACSEYQGALKSDLEDLAEIFLKNYREKKLFIAAKVAQSLDGQIALKSGESKWITSESSREYVHELRSWYDAVLVGRGTIEADDPSLDVRHPKIAKDNYLIIIDPQGKILKSIIQDKKEYKFLKVHSKEKIIFAINESAKQDYNFFDENKYNFEIFSDLQNLTDKLWCRNIKSIFIEGGAFTYSTFIKAGLVDRIHVFTAPVIIGSGNGLSWSEKIATQKLSDKLILKNIKYKLFGVDFYTTGKILK
ncbi:MAG: bifunctional diaminohydroxyphosphoribosylaminopyrimidine deaminase/5-amino-6-(5-phosphoribosylamino)uracil reductase RibD [Pseudobdellovibrio sp.]